MKSSTTATGRQNGRATGEKGNATVLLSPAPSGHLYRTRGRRLGGFGGAPLLSDHPGCYRLGAARPVGELRIICALCRTPYDEDECPTCREEREAAKSVIEERLRQDSEEKDRIIKDLDKWLEDLGRD